MTSEELFNILSRLTSLPGPSGSESEIVKALESMIGPYADQTSVDGFYNFVAEKRSKSKTAQSVALYAHMDEIGAMVKYIDEKGYLYFEPLGGWDPRVLPSQRVHVATARGTITGVVGCKPPHIQTREEFEKAYKLDDLFIDIGARSRDEASKWGIKVGSTVTLQRTLEALGKGTLVSGKAIDDRVGCAIIADVARRMAERELDYTLYYVGTTQEETSLKGAKVSAFGMTPSLALVIDDTTGGDMPGVDEKRAPIKLGMGPSITIMDSGFMISEKVRQLLVSAAEDDYIPYQLEVLRGGTTDAATIQSTKIGVPTGVISVPVRYGHSSVEVLDLQDMANAMRLVVSVLTRLDEKRLQEVR